MRIPFVYVAVIGTPSQTYGVSLSIWNHTKLPAVAVLCWGHEVTGPPNLAKAAKFLIGSIVISLSRCCLPNDEGPGPQIFFPSTATGYLTPVISEHTPL